MNLKEMFRYQNKLSESMDTIQLYMNDMTHVMKTTVQHLRSKANSTVADETVDTTAEREYPYSINDMMDFLRDMLHEKEILYGYIVRAKRMLNFDIDSQVEMNIRRQGLGKLYRKMANIRPLEKIERGKGVDYIFNADGNQVAYRYDLKRVSVIDFDRKKAREMSGELSREADAMSIRMDQALINTEVDYQPFFDANDSIEEIFEKWLKRRQEA